MCMTTIPKEENHEEVIHFFHNGKECKTDCWAVYTGKVVLPNRVVLEITEWSELGSTLPSPVQFTEIEHEFRYITPEMIAKKMDAAVAHYVV